MQKKLLITGTILMLTAIVLGAFGRHYFEEKLGTDGVSGFDTAVKYQVWHAIVLMVLSSMHQTLKGALKWTYRGILYGVILFSGSIYVLVILKTMEIDPIPLPVVLTTPLGGTVLILTWGYFLLKLIKLKL